MIVDIELLLIKSYLKIYYLLNIMESN